MSCPCLYVSRLNGCGGCNNLLPNPCFNFTEIQLDIGLQFLIFNLLKYGVLITFNSTNHKDNNLICFSGVPGILLYF